MRREFYSDSIEAFLAKPAELIRDELVRGSGLIASTLDVTQFEAWDYEVHLLKNACAEFEGRGAIFFEYSIPRLGKRVDVILIVDGVIFVLEFKVGATKFSASAVDQVWDYALDLKNFHEPSHYELVVPILVATEAESPSGTSSIRPYADQPTAPLLSNGSSLKNTLDRVLQKAQPSSIDHANWIAGRYRPTPTIIEAALALYNGHSVDEISRSDADDLSTTSNALSEIIQQSKARSQKAICFVTGVPGAGKTLAGLNIATRFVSTQDDLHSVFLSGNGPLVNILREALARDKVIRERTRGNRIKKATALSEVKAFVQNVHHFRDDCLIDRNKPPIEHVALFDEAQRAWNLERTEWFMRVKKKTPHFGMSEPEFLISCLDRHQDWAVVVCLVGGGQEINTGEAGIKEWLESLNKSFPHWHIYLSSRMTDSEYASGRALNLIAGRHHVFVRDELHLAVSMRSFRAERVSQLVKAILDLDSEMASSIVKDTLSKYPIVLTRDLTKAKRWLRKHAQGSERYGLVASSQAQRLKPHAIDVKAPMNPIHWFLNGKEDVRSSYYLEDVATEFHVQGLELDWACVTWDGDFRYTDNGWEHWAFRGKKWNQIRQTDSQTYLKNAYRVLLTRARQGMVIFVPEGDPEDRTRKAAFYDPTFNYLTTLGLDVLQ